MYLARGVLNPRARRVQRDLSNVGQLHRTLMRLFREDVGEEPRRKLGLLYRIDSERRHGGPVLHFQCAEAPDFTRLDPDYFADPRDDLDWALDDGDSNPRYRSVTEERAAIAAGDVFVFRLRANTTRRVETKSLPDGTKRNGKRVPLATDDARLAWLQRHARAGGFAVESHRWMALPLVTGETRGQRLTFAGTQFEGVLSVVDPAAFREALATGLGSGKAFGFGLLSIARAR